MNALSLTYFNHRRRSEAPPRDPSLGAMVLFNSKPKVPLRSYLLPPFTIPEDIEFEYEDSDSNIMMNVDMGQYSPHPYLNQQLAISTPRLAGNVSHSDWFLPNGTEDDMDIL